MFSKILIANRGEIAVRVIRALRELGIASVAVYSGDRPRRDPRPPRADEAYPPGRRPRRRVLPQRGQDPRGHRASRAPTPCTPATASWPRTRPSPAASRRPGSSSSARRPARSTRWAPRPAARELMQAAGVPIVPGTTEPVADVDDARKIIDGRSATPSRSRPPAAAAARASASRSTSPSSRTPSRAPPARARSSSPTPTVYLERYLPDPRHVEVQVLADSHGNVIHLGERDCSVQRRHQKLIEESPGPGRRRGAARAHRQDRHRRGRAPSTTSARARSRACCQDGEYFFLEMNTRVQVEHCVTEMTTGIDIVKEGIRAAAGEALSVTPGRRRPARARDRVPHQRRGRLEELRARPGLDRRLPRAGGARACASTPASAPAARSRRCTTRWSPS